MFGATLIVPLGFKVKPVGVAVFQVSVTELILGFGTPLSFIISQYAWRSVSCGTSDSGYTIVYGFDSCWCSGVCSRTTYRYYDACCATYRRTCYCAYRVAYRMCTRRGIWCYSNRSVRVQGEACRSCCVPSECY